MSEELEYMVVKAVSLTPDDYPNDLAQPGKIIKLTEKRAKSRVGKVVLLSEYKERTAHLDSKVVTDEQKDEERGVLKAEILERRRVSLSILAVNEDAREILSDMSDEELTDSTDDEVLEIINVGQE